MVLFMTSKTRQITYHILYWIVFLIFFTLVWGTYDDDYYRNFMTQVLSLPSRLTLVYVTLGILFPLFLKDDNLLKFVAGYFGVLFLCTVIIQRSMMLYVIEGRYLDFKSEDYWNVLELTNTALDVNLAAIIPVGWKFFGHWIQSRRKLSELQVLNQKLARPKTQFILFKKGVQKHKVFLHDIKYLESQKNYIKVHTRQKEHVFYESISNLENTLKDHRFLRVHRSYIVNLAFLESFSANHIMIDGVKIPIGRKYKNEASRILSK